MKGRLVGGFALVPALLLAWVMLRPLGGRLFLTHVLGPFGGADAVMQSGILEWTGRHFLRPDPWFNLPIFFPEPGALAFMDSLLGQALVLLPLRSVGWGTIAGLYNVAMLLSLLLAAAAFLLIWRTGGGAPLAAGFGALALIGSPYALSQIGHLNQLPPPFALVSLACLWSALRPRRPGRTKVRAAWWLWGATLGWQAGWGWYGFAFGGAAAAVLMLFGLGWYRRRGLVKNLIRPASGPFLLMLVMVLMLGRPYAEAAARHEDFQRTPVEVRAFSADLSHLLNRGAYRAEFGDWLGGGVSLAQRAEGRGRQVLHPGWVALVLAIVGWTLRKHLDPQLRRQGWVVLAIGAVGLILAFGDSFAVPGLGRRWPLPFGIMQEVFPPLRALRAVWRFSFLAVLAICWWAAAGFSIMTRLPRRGIARACLGVALMALLFCESIPVRLPVVGISPLAAGAQVWAGMPAGAVLTLPAPAREADEDATEAAWLHRALMHGRPVTGGVSGWVPPSTRSLRRELAACERGEEDPGALFARLRGLGIASIEVARAWDRERGGYWERALARWGQAPLAAGDYAVYRMGAAASPSGAWKQ
jgi:hypothetical protein